MAIGYTIGGVGVLMKEYPEWMLWWSDVAGRLWLAVVGGHAATEAEGRIL